MGGLFLSLFSTCIWNIVAVVNSQHGVMGNSCKASSTPPSYSAEHDLLISLLDLEEDRQSCLFSLFHLWMWQKQSWHWVKKSVFIVLQICLLLQDRGSVNIYLTDTSQDLIFLAAEWKKALASEKIPWKLFCKPCVYYPLESGCPV